MSETNHFLSQKLSDICNTIYKPNDTGINIVSLIKNITIQGITDFAKNNRLDHYLSLSCKHSINENQEWRLACETIVVEYNNYKNKLANSIKKVTKCAGKTPFLVIKTFSCYPHITSDLDILVMNIQAEDRLISALKNLHWQNPEEIEIDVNHEISWSGADAVSHKFIWDNTRQMEFEGINFLVPNSKLDILIRIGHMAFELAQVRLGEILHIFRQAKEIDWDEIATEAEYMGWPKTFRKLSNILNQIHKTLFDEPFLNTHNNKKIYNKINFPFQLPYAILLLGVIEKRAWGKIYGGRYIVKDRCLRWLQKITR